MSDADGPDLLAVLRSLDRHGVDYVLIGGMAAMLHGSTVGTQDIDIMARDAVDNMERLAAALNDLAATCDVAESASVDELWGLNSRWDTAAGRVDVLVSAAGPHQQTRNWRSLAPGAETVTVRGLTVHVVAFEDLIELKLAAGRPHDLAVVRELAPDALSAQRDTGSPAQGPGPPDRYRGPER